MRESIQKPPIEYPKNPRIAIQQYIENTPSEELTPEAIWTKARSFFRSPNEATIKEYLEDTAHHFSKTHPEKSKITFAAIGID